MKIKKNFKVEKKNLYETKEKNKNSDWIFLLFFSGEYIYIFWREKTKTRLVEKICWFVIKCKQKIDSKKI